MLEITEAPTEIQIMEIQITEIPIMEAKITEIPIMEIQTMATESKSPKCTVWKFEDFSSIKFKGPAKSFGYLGLKLLSRIQASDEGLGLTP